MTNDKRYVLLASDEPKPMGDTLFEYARPLFARLPQDHTFAELRATILFAALVWNVGLSLSSPTRSPTSPGKCRGGCDSAPRKVWRSFDGCSRERKSASAATIAPRWT